MAQQETKFVDGLFYNEPREGAPDFVLAGMSVDKVKFTEWLSQQEVDAKGYVKIDVLRAKSGKAYLKLNDFKPKEQSKPVEASEPKSTPEDLPF